MAQKDNTTLANKVALRLEALAACRDPIILETHGGFGKVYQACYSRFTGGAVFEVDTEKAEALALQRPTWSVYESPCEPALAAGACDHRCFNFLDVDPYGSPFQAIEGFFSSPRPMPEELHLVVQDGLRQKVQLGGAWNCGDLKDIVADFGNDLFMCYLQVANKIVRRLAKVAGLELRSWKGYHCGAGKLMTHYWAVLHRVDKKVVRKAA